MKVLIDNGHGENTPGKRSPDGRLREYAYCREIADRVVVELRKQGIEAERIVKEEIDVPLSERCRRANEAYGESGKKAILVSIHCDAAGNGSSWMNARGWSVLIAQNASYNSRKLAGCLVEAAYKKGVTVRRPAPYQDYWVQNLAICRDTLCPAVLVENFFQDNREDVEFLLSEEGKKCVTDITVEGIINYIRGKA